MVLKLWSAPLIISFILDSIIGAFDSNISPFGAIWVMKSSLACHLYVNSPCVWNSTAGYIVEKSFLFLTFDHFNFSIRYSSPSKSPARELISIVSYKLQIHPGLSFWTLQGYLKIEKEIEKNINISIVSLQLISRSSRLAYKHVLCNTGVDGDPL